jgi:hypothetical protein
MSDDLTSALRDAERRMQAAQLAGDADVLDGLLDDRLIYTGGPMAPATASRTISRFSDRAHRGFRRLKS